MVTHTPGILCVFHYYCNKILILQPFYDCFPNKTTDQMSVEPAVSSMNKNSGCLLSAYNVPSAVLSTLYALSHFILMTAPCVKY